MIRIIYRIILILCLPVFIYAQTLAVIQVNAKSKSHSNTPVSISLDNLPVPLDAYRLKLVEKTKSGKINVPCQVEAAQTPRLWWILDNPSTSKSRTYELIYTDSSYTAPSLMCKKTDTDLILQQNGTPVLSYRHAVQPAPPGVDPLYNRSGFIHPLWTPNGQELTRIQPPDHYHHVGIWNPWTKTHIEGREVDFWNLGKGLGTVRFAGVLSTTDGSVYTGFKVRQEHVDLKAETGPEVAINEVWDVRAWNISPDNNVWLWDMSTVLNCTGKPVELTAYRYGGGIGYRALEYWTKDNCTVLTSEGKDRAEADGTSARWCNVNGEMPQSGKSGILFMSHPTNREHPEPMRVWPLNANGDRGDMYFEFCPIRHKTWNLVPGNTYGLKYRMLVYDGTITAEQAEQYWQDFANPPKITVDWKQFQ